MSRIHSTRETTAVPEERIQSRILVVRGQRVLLDADLAALYRVSTNRPNEQVRRNARKYPEDFVFQLNEDEFGRLRSQSATSKPGRGGRRHSPYAFTEHGAIQAANVLSSDAAVEMSVHVVRAFVRLRQLLINHRALLSKLDELNSRIGEHDEQIASIVDAIRQLTTPDGPQHGSKIGFHDGDR